METEPSEHDPHDEPSEPEIEDPEHAVEQAPPDRLDDDVDEREVNLDEESAGLPEAPTGP